VRNQAIRVISQLRPEDSSEVLGALLGDADLSVRDSALNALILMQDLKTVRAILLTDTYSGAVRSRAIERLMSNTGGALVLLRMLDSNKLPESVATEVVSRAINHPDSSVRTLYDKHIPAGQRPKTLGEAIKAADILALAGNATRGEQVFFQSSAAQCVNCHSVHGKGATVGPDLSQIGKKYERATLLETILEPSKAIAPEYITYLLETERGQVFAGFLVEQTDRRVILKDPKGELVSVGANEVIELAKTARSAMPDLVLRDVTAQDAADLLAFLTTLKQGSQSIGTFRVVGPFDNPQRSVDAKAGPEESLANPNLNAEFPTLDAKKVRWELVTSESSAGFPAIDTVRFDRTRGFRANSVSHYFLAYAESPSEQDATLLIGSDDGCKVWINGQQVHRNEVTRALGFGQDRVPVRFKAGRNVILIKVVNGDGAGGLSLGVSSSDVLQLKTD
jgi:putative heme-binding domain-containing protein